MMNLLIRDILKRRDGQIMHSMVLALKRAIPAAMITIMFFPTWSIKAQVSEQQLDLLTHELHQLINAERVEQGVSSLSGDATLYKAALLQTIYVSRKQRLTHQQSKNKTKNPLKRVQYFGGTHFSLVGENILFTTKFSLPLNNMKIRALAKQMFSGWKGSSGHYVNLINPNYTHHGLAFHYNPKNGAIYATQVLGKKRFRNKGISFVD